MLKLFESSRNSPFKGPFSTAQCDAAVSKQAVQVDSCEFGSAKYFMLCGLGGILSCGKYYSHTTFSFFF